MENFEQIFYLDCPHFTIGRVDQWGEHGYLLFEGTVYAYEEDRKEQLLPDIRTNGDRGFSEIC